MDEFDGGWLNEAMQSNGGGVKERRKERKKSVDGVSLFFDLGEVQFRSAATEAGERQREGTTFEMRECVVPKYHGGLASVVVAGVDASERMYVMDYNTISRADRYG